MHDPHVVRGSHRLGERTEDSARLLDGDRPPTDASSEVFTVEKLGRDPRRQARLVDPGGDDKDDVVALDLHADAHLGLEACSHCGILYETGLQELEDPLGTSAEVLGQVGGHGERANNLEVFGEDAPRL